MRTNHRSVEEYTFLIELDLQMLEDRLPVPPPRPEREPVINGLPWPKALGKVSPGNSRLEPVENRVDKETVAQRRGGTAAAREHYGQQVPLSICQSMAVCHNQL